MESEDWFLRPTHNGMPVKQTVDSRRESNFLRLDIYDMILGIKYGHKCKDQWKRKAYEYEICFEFGKQTIRIVYTESYSIDDAHECYLIIHVGVAR